MNRLRRLLHRPDFRRNPVGAVYKRLAWRLRWSVSSAPWRLPLGESLHIDVIHGGAGALLYYQGFSEPETAAFLRRRLRPGMTFFDVGAHLGEYTLLAAALVGPSGSVHAFEPARDMFALLEKNIATNGLVNVSAHCCAASATDGEADFFLHPEPSLSCLAPVEGHRERFAVPVRRLDTHAARTGAVPDLIKVDVEGAEVEVLRGAAALLNLPSSQAPEWILEYGKRNYRRFGHSLESLTALLAAHGYRLFALEAEARAETANLLASKREVTGLTPLAPTAALGAQA